MNQTHYLCPECQKWRQQITLIEFTPSEARRPTKTRLGRDTFARWSTKNGWSHGARGAKPRKRTKHRPIHIHMQHTRDAEEMLLRDTRNCNRHSHAHECIHNWTPWQTLPKLLFFILLLLLLFFLLLLLFLSLL